MAEPKEKACKKCLEIFSDTTNVCPNCNEPTTTEWLGCVIILDHTKSDIAKKMGITRNGKFALKVR